MRRLWRSLVLLVIAGAVLAFITFGLFLSNRSVDRHDGTHCSRPLTNIGFLKTHKCASTTMQNILFRFGLRNNLTFVLPARGNYLSRERFRASLVNQLPWHSLGYNILALHSKWDQQQVASIMPADTVYITVLRDPLELFKSLYSYLELDEVESLEQFAMRDPLPSDRFMDIMGQNQMLWDMGLSQKELQDMPTVRKRVAQAEEQFHLVMIAERMEVSLVLLKNYLCWRNEDVVSLRLNARHPSTWVTLSSVARTRLKHWLMGDYILYNHFYRIFDNRVKEFGAKRMRRELSELHAANIRVSKQCRISHADHQQQYGSFALFSKRVMGYLPSNRSRLCRNLARGELQFVDMLRQRQLTMAVNHVLSPDDGAA